MHRSRTPIYRTWYGMMSRCYKPNLAIYKYYGGRGIRVCDRWHSFDSFAADMGPKPFPGHAATLERIDNNGNYEPDNVRWATMKDQCMNTRQVKLLTFNGKTDSIQGWARHFGVSRQAIIGRLRKMTAEEALSLPFRYGRRRFHWTPYVSDRFPLCAELGVPVSEVWR